MFRNTSDLNKSINGRVLIVDDDPQIPYLFARALALDGHSVVVVHTAEQATKCLAEQEFDVMTSDIRMPGMSGVELLRTVRQYDLDLPVILVTGDPKVETAMQAVELGALEYLTKPVRLDVLRASVDRACKLHRLARLKREAMQLLGRVNTEASDRAGLHAAFDRALESLYIVFQPIVLPSERRVFAYEALLRTTEPSLPTPGDVLAAAERLDRLPTLGECIWRLTAEAFSAFLEANPADQETLLFVNLHARDLEHPALTRAGAPLPQLAHRVVLEITERTSLADVKQVDARIAELRRVGYRIAIDDLGEGYAGLTSFAVLQPEFVKLDMSLVRDVHISPIRQRLIHAVAAVCSEMGMKLIAEGVETPQERNTLLELGCTLLQGYLYARPSRTFAPLIFD